MKKFLTAVLASSLFFMPTSHAEIQTYTGEGTYVMSEGENLGVAKDRAKMDALRNAQEKAGVYIRSYSKMKNFELIDDEVIAIASNIVKLVQDPQYYPLEAVANLEGVLVKVMITANINSDDLNQWLGKGDAEKQMLIAQNKDLRQQLDAQAKELEELKRRLAGGASAQDKEIIVQKFADEEKVFLSTQKVEEAWKLYNKGDYSGAVSLHDEAIELNPQNASAWYGRGTAYNDLNLYKLS
ncbi:MAG: tetratricopeptide repeat protein, partial [Selenomonadaceae bacterium]|nr:tetratricopeptide repeat protein [Selenomonadaceae bacterium]